MTPGTAFELTLPKLRELHTVTSDDRAVWGCSCGAGTKRGPSPNSTRSTARAAAERHLKAEHRKLIAELLAH